jgi:hypothetical protein
LAKSVGVQLGDVMTAIGIGLVSAQKEPLIEIDSPVTVREDDIDDDARLQERAPQSNPVTKQPRANLISRA